MSHTASRKARPRKAKKSYTLSPDSVTFLETLRRKQHAPSASAVLEDILQRVRRGAEKRAMEKAVVDYYDSLSPEESEEQERWGEFAMGEFPDQVV